jgi:hypothetical protein
MSDEELRQLVASNARAIQAMQDARVEERLEFQETIGRLEGNIVRLEDNIRRLTDIQAGMVNLLVSLDEERPTVLRRLNSIENKVDRILERKDRQE